MRRLALSLLSLVLVLVPTACRVDSDVLINVNADGSGVVTVSVVLDRDAASKLGDPKTAIKVDDLRTAGWKVAEPVTDKGSGEVTLSAEREFASPRELTVILNDVGGGSPDNPGVFSGVKLNVDNGFASTGYSFRADIALSGSLEQFSDQALKEALGGLPLGRTPDQLAAEGAGKNSVTLNVTLDLPGGKVDSNGTAVDGRTRWTLHPDSGEATDTELTASSTDSQRSVLLLLGVGAVLLVVAAGFAGVALARTRR